MSAERTHAERHATPQVSANGHAPARPGADDRDGGRPGRPGGLAWEAQFAPRDGDVFDTVEWDYRDVLIRAVDGSTVFRQDRVHAPASWSDQAVQVVASKYFHGDPAKGNDPATGGRESSVRQLIHRACSTAQAWGLADGYFASGADAERFGRDLTWLCLHQHAAFNSPVWFNLGLGQVYGLKGDTDNFRWDRESRSAVPCEDSYINGQCSACFIQPVEDSIDGIMALAASEARLFKGGSGTGTDLSTLRSSREPVKGGGKASGPVSFMRVWDSVAGTIKSGGRSRRAAKIQTLKCSHPDIKEFIVCKRDEDRKARALIRSGAAGGGMTGAYHEAYSSVMFQNSNLSVRLLDAFLGAAEVSGTAWQTRPVLDSTADPMPSYDASELLDLMAECTWECGDPGYQFHDTINSWNTTPNSGEIKSSNPCGEYNHVDNSACNLASLNLMKFRSHDGNFDVPRFKSAVRTLVVAQDVLLDRASYPTAAVAETVYRLRQLGLNHSNLGALLMTMGLPYDSDDGRTVAGAVTAIMHGAALEVSAELSEMLGPFEEYGPNRGPMQQVVRRHHLAAVNLFASVKERDDPFYGLAYQGVRAMEAAAKRGFDRGFRNAQSTLEVPNGTTGFMMDCDTFGVEPELGLVKYKNLAGGGVMKIINGAVKESLIKLGYSDQPRFGTHPEHPEWGASSTLPSQVGEILDYIQNHGKVEGAPHLKPEHLPVFDCSFEPPGGGRSIAPSGHVKMLAAVQPFLSGASSKTVNLPASATPAEIRKVVLDAWKLGVKALAVYRDGSKGAQPLSTGTKAGAGGTPAQSPAEVTGARPEAPASVPPRPVPQRRRLPDTRDSLTHKFCVAGHEGYLTVGLYPDGSPGEVFLRMAKEGSTVGGLMDAVATSVSLGLQYGVPLDVYAHKFAHGRYEPSGPTHNPELPFASSLTDYVFRWLASQFPLGGKSALRASSEDIDVATWGKIFTPAVPVGVEVSNGPAAGLSSMTSGDTPACPDCGTLTVRRGTCCHCPNCSWTGGCGG